MNSIIAGARATRLEYICCWRVWCWLPFVIWYLCFVLFNVRSTRINVCTRLLATKIHFYLLLCLIVYVPVIACWCIRSKIWTHFRPYTYQNHTFLVYVTATAKQMLQSLCVCIERDRTKMSTDTYAVGTQRNCATNKSVRGISWWKVGWVRVPHTINRKR